MTLRQALTLTALFAGFATHTEAAPLIGDGNLNAGRLHGYGTSSAWPPNSSTQLSVGPSGPASNTLKELMPDISNETGGFNVRFVWDHSFDAKDKNQMKPLTMPMPEPANLALLLLGFLALATIRLQRKKTVLPCPSPEPFDHKAEGKSRFSSAKLLRRDARNNILLFKFLRQRQHSAF